MKTMERLLFCLSLSLVMICFYSCSDEKEIGLDTQLMQQDANKTQEEKIQELIEFVETLNANLEVEQVQTRGRFWDRIRRILLGDAYGYGWGVDNGFSPRGGLIAAAVFSIIAAFDSSSSGVWKLNSDWKVYDSPLRDYEIIGNDHNKVVYNLMITDRTIANGTFTNDYLCTATNKKLMSYGYSDEMSTLQRGMLLGVMIELKNCTTVEQLNSLMRGYAPNRMSEFEFVETYVNGLASISDKTSVRNYTQQINARIDSSSFSGVVRSRLKTMVAIAENSKALWIEVN